MQIKDHGKGNGQATSTWRENVMGYFRVEGETETQDRESLDP